LNAVDLGGEASIVGVVEYRAGFVVNWTCADDAVAGEGSVDGERGEIDVIDTWDRWSYACYRGEG
jgi:hypothetical protein